MSDGLPNDWTDKDQEDLDRSEPESEPSYYDRLADGFEILHRDTSDERRE